MFTALVLSLPTRNSTLRMRVWRALKEAGCAVLRDGVYLLPAGCAGGAVLAEMDAEINAGGGFAMTMDLTPELEETYALGEPRPARKRLRQLERAKYAKRTWATRSDLWVDRLASAWLIKRFIDKDAKFLWIGRPRDCPKRAVGFDFDGAEFTH